MRPTQFVTLTQQDKDSLLGTATNCDLLPCGGTQLARLAAGYAGLEEEAMIRKSEQTGSPPDLCSKIMFV